MIGGARPGEDVLDAPRMGHHAHVDVCPVWEVGCALNRERRMVLRDQHPYRWDGDLLLCPTCGVEQPCDVNQLLDEIVNLCTERDMWKAEAGMLRDRLAIVRERIHLAYMVAGGRT